MMFGSIYFRVYLTNVNHYFPSLVFTGSSGLTFTVGELPGSLASIGKFLNVIFFFRSIFFTFFKHREGFSLRNEI